MLAILAVVFEATIMPKQIQTNLSPPDRAAQLAMASFLEPVREIFAFLEDAMIIKVGYAIAAGRYRELNALLHISIIGGAMCGLVAFAAMAIIAFNDASANVLLNPSAVPNQRIIDSGCSLIPTAAQILMKARPYWLLISASWIPQVTTVTTVTTARTVTTAVVSVAAAAVAVAAAAAAGVVGR